MSYGRVNLKHYKKIHSSFAIMRDFPQLHKMERIICIVSAQYSLLQLNAINLTNRTFPHLNQSTPELLSVDLKLGPGNADTSAHG